jgi:outer membrane protein assembly factor BamE (lipoprotein component of BamABCDE complex)
MAAARRRWFWPVRAWRLALLAGGCTAIKDHRGYLVDTALVDSVMVGIDNRQSVEHTLGRPTFVSQYGKRCGITWHRYQAAAFHRPRATAQTMLRVRFDDKGNVPAGSCAAWEGGAAGS